jgi:hypothetical protein
MDAGEMEFGDGACAAFRCAEIFYGVGPMTGISGVQ